MTTNDPTDARGAAGDPRPDDQDVDAGTQPLDRTTAGSGDVTLTTDDDAQRDDLTVRPGNS